MDRRALLLSIAGGPLATLAQAQPRLSFPADFGAHPASKTEWWYTTGTLESGARLWGFQVTFFRSSSGIGGASTSRFNPAQLLFAHAALTDLEQRRLRHDQRIARSGFGIAEAEVGDTAIALRDWRMRRDPVTAAAVAGRYTVKVVSDSAGFAFDLRFDTTQPVLLQGDAGISQKGPAADHTSHYYSEPQLAVTGRLTVDGKAAPVLGRAWLDHEWSDAYLPAGAVGWDWIGMNLADGTALMAFRMRRNDGSALYAGGSVRAPGQPVRAFGPNEVVFTPGRRWESPASRSQYPVEWDVATPAGRFTVKALLDNQELDSRSSTGAIYWEGLSDLLDAAGRRIGRGYLEMTGYAEALRL